MNGNNNEGGNKKPEYMTSLSGTRLVPKTHGRIVFRGLIDTLEAEVIEAQALAFERGETDICGKLGEVLHLLRNIMAAEVRETPLPTLSLFGLDEKELHRMSLAGGNAAPLPDYTRGPVAARLNTLRAKTREAELCAVKIFGPGNTGMETEERPDIILALNRLSSALWGLFCARAGKEPPLPGGSAL